MAPVLAVSSVASPIDLTRRRVHQLLVRGGMLLGVAKKVGSGGASDIGARWLTAIGAVALLVALVVALGVLYVAGAEWFSAARITGFLATIAFSAAFFSAAAGRRSAGAAAASVATARRAYGQQLYELARSTHADLTTGEVARARERLGTLVRVRQALWREGIKPGQTHESAVRQAYDALNNGEQMAQWRRDWFTLLWSFQRVQAALDLLAEAPPEAAYGQRDAHSFLSDLVRSQVRFLNTDGVAYRAALEEYFQAPIDDRESTLAFRDLVHRLLVETRPERWSDPVTTQDGETLRALLLGDPDFRLGDLSDTQFLALHQVVYQQDGARFEERAAFGARLRTEAERAERTAGQEPGLNTQPSNAPTLWARSQAIEIGGPATAEVPDP